MTIQEPRVRVHPEYRPRDQSFMIPFDDWIGPEASADARTEIANQEQDPPNMGREKIRSQIDFIRSGGWEQKYLAIGRLLSYLTTGSDLKHLQMQGPRSRIRSNTPSHGEWKDRISNKCNREWRVGTKYVFLGERFSVADRTSKLQLW